jgi:prevent-host-death family protein
MAMQISVTDAKAQLTDLLRRAEAGDKIVLTRHGQPVARLVPIKASQARQSRRAVVEAMREAARSEAFSGLGDVQYRDFIFGSDGLPAWVRARRR